MFALFLSAVWKILAVGIVVGAGLPALFSVGIRAMAYGKGGDSEISHEQGHPIGTVVGYFCFALVVAAIALGIAIVVSSGFGYSMHFDSFFPTFVKKGH